VRIVLKSGSLNHLEPSGPVQASNGIALPLHTRPHRLCANPFSYAAGKAFVSHTEVTPSFSAEVETEQLQGSTFPSLCPQGAKGHTVTGLKCSLMHINGGYELRICRYVVCYTLWQRDSAAFLNVPGTKGVSLVGFSLNGIYS
jgi:hypothetical protein